MSKKKILLDLERLRYPYSGIANVFRNLAKGSENKNQQFDITYFGDFSALDFKLSNIIEWKKWHKFYENFSQKFDIIHVSHQLSSYFQKNYKNSIKVVTVHDLNFLHENLSDKKRRKMLKKVNNNLKNTDYLVCISEYAKKDVEENKHLLTFNKLKEIVVIHNGVELPEDRIYDLGKFSFLNQKKYILNIGVLFDKKNQLSLVEMLPFIDDDLVLIASDEKNPYAENLRTRIKELKLENRVHFLRNISEEEKYALIQNCDAMCHPSIAEGFGIPPIEAMAFGKPVFLSTFTSLPEIGGDAAFYFENFEPQKMAEFFTEKMKFYEENEEDLSLKIKNWTKQYDYKVMSNNYLKFYEEILEKSIS
ncbi:glycosyltransferase family 4 protein [Kaistella jeonii]|uniref:Glycosyl transferase family 1 n=1 Tax=Kaistella jeonii TaxID=266749 RepID=A0A0C1FCV4_9FLAO|nr:glycosyltransferase family 1 protein [Kaistella jeonii]KIA89648.1 glycosyl transferase family 1 [Kaistella jeonii]SFB89210.1 Glycosyltransferase involved in cell wall bisynthesis [Kaistella jeonii]VEI95866.1 glycogen synthase [Kaistella jeonii]